MAHRFSIDHARNGRVIPMRRFAAALTAAIAVWGAPAGAEEAAVTAAPIGERAARTDPRLTQAAERLHVIETAALAVQIELRRARQDHDAGKTACVDDRLTRLHVAARAARARLDEMRAAGEAGDDRAATLAVTRLAHLEERARRLHAEVRTCAEREVWIERAGATTVRVVVPALPDAGDHVPAVPVTRP